MPETSRVSHAEAVSKHLLLLKGKDLPTYEHSVRTGRIAQAAASHLKLNEQQRSLLVYGCYLHDMGKLFVPSEVLNKTERLNAHEWESIRSHPARGAELLQADPEIDAEIVRIVACHHEWWNGRGYPHGLKGEAIPLLARYCAIIDALDCMLSDRPYRRRLSIAEARNEILKQGEQQFDQQAAEALLCLPDSCFEPPYTV